MDGFLILNKPLRLSSQQSVSRAKRLLNIKKAGHVGSLDPLATGVLPIAFNQATKFVDYFLALEKVYSVAGELGKITTTGDAEGEIISECNVPEISLQTLQTCIESFLGMIQQIPPQYSAIKFQGKPLYHYARQGIEIAVQPRTVEIKSIALKHFDGKNFSLEVQCSKGTYIRSLIQDIGNALGCGAYVTQLHRKAVGLFEDRQALMLEHISAHTPLLTVDAPLMHFPKIDLDEEMAKRILCGQKIPFESNLIGLVRIYCNQQFLGLAEKTDHLLIAKRLMQF